MEISGFQALRSGLRDVPPRTAVGAAAHDPHTLEAVFQAQRDGLIEEYADFSGVHTGDHLLARFFRGRLLDEPHPKARCGRRFHNYETEYASGLPGVYRFFSSGCRVEIRLKRCVKFPK